jgi:hypothetical protein
MKFDEFLSEIGKIVSASQQGDMFGNKQKVTEDSVELCAKFLRGQGFSVREPMAYPVKIGKLDDLLTVFYGTLRGIYEANFIPYYNEKKDRAIAKKFVENRVEHDGVDYKTALQQCGLIIQTIFDHPDIFKFDTPPTFGIFGQAGMGWVTDRAVQIMNKKVAKDAATATERAANKMSEEIEKKCPKMGFSLDELQAIRNKLEVQNGKKES